MMFHWNILFSDVYILLHSYYTTYIIRKAIFIPVSEKQKQYAQKWDKDNMRTIATRVRKEDAKDFKTWCTMRGVSTTSEIKRFVMSKLEQYYAVMEQLRKCSKSE